MELTKKLQVKKHCLMPGQTINAVIKKFNLQDVQENEMKILLDNFKLFNNHPIFKPGMEVFVPILERHYSKVFTYPENQ